MGTKGQIFTVPLALLHQTLFASLELLGLKLNFIGFTILYIHFMDKVLYVRFLQESVEVGTE